MSRALLVIALAAWGLFVAASVRPQAVGAADSTVHVGDTIAVRVLNHPDISAPQTLVDAQGNIVVPLAGSLHVAGMTLTAIGTAIQTALATYIKFPAVDVLMEKPGTAIFVAGGPGGTLKFVEGETLSSALADLPKVDGVDVVRSRVDLRRVNLIRDGATLGTYDIVALSAHGQPGPALVPGDTIVLSNKPISVHVRGDVVEPGTVFLSAQEVLADAIAQSGGLKPSAATAGVELRRGGTSTTLALGSPTFQQPAQDGDEIVVPVAPRVNVVGMVGAPGEKTLRSDSSLLSALYIAGGPQKYANIKDVSVVHQGVEHSYDVTALTHGDTTQNPKLADGDVVFVPEGHKVDYQSIFQTIVQSLFFIRF